VNRDVVLQEREADSAEGQGNDRGAASVTRKNSLSIFLENNLTREREGILRGEANLPIGRLDF